VNYSWSRNLRDEKSDEAHAKQLYYNVVVAQKTSRGACNLESAFLALNLKSVACPLSNLAKTNAADKIILNIATDVTFFRCKLALGWMLLTRRTHMRSHFSFAYAHGGNSLH
jgi:hypothetical protein